MNDQPASNRPADSVRIGNIEAAIWRNANETATGANPFYTISLLRHYKDAQGEWKTTNSYSVDDLPVVAKVSDKALDLVLALQKGRGRA
jgi:hypothetical protein